MLENCNLERGKALATEKSAQSAYDEALLKLNSGGGLPQTGPKHSARHDSPPFAFSLEGKISWPNLSDDPAPLNACKAEAMRAMDAAKASDKARDAKYFERMAPMMNFVVPQDIGSLVVRGVDNVTDTTSKPSQPQLTKRSGDGEYGVHVGQVHYSGSSEANPKPSESRMIKRDEERRVGMGKDYYTWLSGTMAAGLRNDLDSCRQDKWEAVQKYWHAFEDVKTKYNKLVEVVRSLKSEASSATKASTSVSTFTTTVTASTTVTVTAMAASSPSTSSSPAGFTVMTLPA